MQLQHMRMLNQFQNGNLPLNLVIESDIKRRQTQRERKKSEDVIKWQNTQGSQCHFEATELWLIDY